MNGRLKLWPMNVWFILFYGCYSMLPSSTRPVALQRNRDLGFVILRASYKRCCGIHRRVMIFLRRIRLDLDAMASTKGVGSTTMDVEQSDSTSNK